MIETCECKVDMKPRWSKDEPKIFVCQRCGKCVPGYEQMWLMRERLTKNGK